MNIPTNMVITGEFGNQKRQYDSCNSKQQANHFTPACVSSYQHYSDNQCKNRNAPMYKVENPSYISAAIKETESRFQPHSDIVAFRRDVIT